MGQPAYEVTDEVLEKVETFASQGLTKEQTALALGIGRSTLFKNQANNVDFADAIKRGQAKGIQQVANALHDNAMNGNVTAQIFYLKNRAPDEWKDRKDMDINVIERKPIEMSDEDILAELRSHRENALGTGSKTTH